MLSAIFSAVKAYSLVKKTVHVKYKNKVIFVVGNKRNIEKPAPLALFRKNTAMADHLAERREAHNMLMEAYEDRVE